MGKRQGDRGRSKARLDDAIYVRLIDQLFGTIGALASGVIATGAFAMACWARTHEPLFLAAAVGLVATTVVRVAILMLYRRATARSPFTGWSTRRMRAWEGAYVAGALLWSGIIGVTSFYGAQSGDHAVELFCATISIGIIGGSSGRNAARPWIVLAQIGVLLVPYGLGLWMEGGLWHRALLLLVACMALAVKSSTNASNAALVGTMVKEADLAVTNGRFATTIDNVNQGLCLVDDEMVVLLVNDRFNEILGSTAGAGEDLVGACPEVVDLAARMAEVAEAATPMRHRTADGRLVEFRVRRTPGEATVLVAEDVTERDANERRIAHMASHDALTDLPNARLVTTEIEAAVAEGKPFAVLALDLDKFKEVNDTLGHPVGDELLRAVAARLRACARPQDVVARIGGDEFLVLMRGGEPALLAARMVEEVSHPHAVDGNDIRIGVSIGIAPSEDGAGGTELRRRADLALYRAKADPSRRHCTYHADMGSDAAARRAMAADLRVAIAEGDLVVHFQPIVDVASDRVACCEALVRWQRKNADGTRSMVRPDQFIGLAEETGLIVALGGLVLRKACLAAASWPDGVKVAVNVSALQMRGDVLARQVRDALLASGLAGNRLELEITESQSMEDVADSRRIMADMAAMGVSIALDDFGTGRSSLAYLHELHFGKVKIDRSFMRAALGNEGARALVRMITEFAKVTGKALVVEGVETDAELAVMRGLGVDLVQGYLFSKPVPAEELPPVMARHQGRAAPQEAPRQRPAQLVALAGGKRT